MPTIDADAHVIETDHTWDFMDSSEARYKPVNLATTDQGSNRLYWIIDGKLKARRTNIGLDTTETSREMLDVEARLKHMDELGVDIQVLYPTIFTRKMADNPAADLALAKSYNRWMAEIWSQAKERLRWVAVPPLLDLSEAPTVLQDAKKNGACGIFMRGFEGERHLSDPYFFPLYDVAGDLDMPICVHAGNANPDVVNFMGVGETRGSFLISKIPVFGSFHSLVFGKIPQKYPRLRFGFVEASSQWVPYVLHDLVRRTAHRAGQHLQGKMTNQVLRENRMYVACQTDDDVPYILSYAGEDNLIMGTDYGHADTAAELEAIATFRKSCPVDRRIVDKILEHNPAALYGL
ncbi:MAG: amidohydrolase family protein [Deltaproteobacteria bacterium]|nr:amidohydrolase family protein [Deltaproteobacteria bacterium]